MFRAGWVVQVCRATHRAPGSNAQHRPNPVAMVRMHCPVAEFHTLACGRRYDGAVTPTNSTQACMQRREHTACLATVRIMVSSWLMARARTALRWPCVDTTACSHDDGHGAQCMACGQTQTHTGRLRDVEREKGAVPPDWERSTPYTSNRLLCAASSTLATPAADLTPSTQNAADRTLCVLRITCQRRRKGDVSQQQATRG